MGERRVGVGFPTNILRRRDIPFIPRLTRLVSGAEDRNGAILQRYFESPPQSFLERINRTRVHYVASSMPREAKYRMLLDQGLSTEIRSNEMSTVKRVAAVRHLIDAIDRDFGDRPIAIQGVACSIGERVDIEKTADLPELEVRTVWRLIAPAAYDAPMPTPIDIPVNTGVLSQQALTFFDFMYASATSARERASARQKSKVFPAAVVYDLENIKVEHCLQRQTKSDNNVALQLRSMSLPIGRAAREAAVLGLYVCDFPLIS